VDLDGPIFRFKGWRGLDHFGPRVPGAVRALRWLHRHGWRIIVHTCRLNTGLNPEHQHLELYEKVEAALNAAGIPYDAIEDRKPYADFYVDDNAVRFDNWGQVLETITSLSRSKRKRRKT
jgi:hypothetical protein